MTDFEHQVKREILSQPGGARFPSVVPLRYHGKTTGAQSRLMELFDGAKHELEREVMRAVRNLQRQGEIIFLARLGYTWCVHPATGKWDDDREVERPINGCNVPHYWEHI